GFTLSEPKNWKECLSAGGICFPFGCPIGKRIGRCSLGVRCCKRKVSFLDILSGYERPAVLRQRGVGRICCESLWRERVQGREGGLIWIKRNGLKKKPAKANWGGAQRREFRNPT
ncbi:hypothetical protein G0U57_017744, partial [Chelydra serpentina]